MEDVARTMCLLSIPTSSGSANARLGIFRHGLRRVRVIGIGEIMKIADSIRGVVWVPKFTAMRIGLSGILLITLVSGCGSVVANSESYYQNNPRRPINWREYLTD